jgi:hypothetical protein
MNSFIGELWSDGINAERLRIGIIYNNNFFIIFN